MLLVVMAAAVRGVLLGVTGVPSLPGVPVEHRATVIIIIVTHEQQVSRPRDMTYTFSG